MTTEYIPNTAFPTARQNLNATFSRAFTLQAGLEPTSPQPYEIWSDSGNKLLKVRNAANDGWITLGYLDKNFFGLLLPTGVIVPYAGATAPSSFLLCNGAAVSRSVYADLFSTIGITYGSGNGTTTFNLPNLQGRIPLGVGTSPVSGITRNLGQTGGVDQVTLAIANMPSHNHGGSVGYTDVNHSHTGNTGNESNGHVHTGLTNLDGSHAHGLNQVSNGPVEGSGPRIRNGSETPNHYTGYAGSTHQHAFTTNGANTTHYHGFTTNTVPAGLNHTHSISSQGSGQPFSVLPAFIAINYLIKI